MAEAHVNTAAAGPEVAAIDIPEGDVRVMWGPLGGAEPGFIIKRAKEALAHLEAGGAWITWNPANVRARIALLVGASFGDTSDTAPPTAVRSA